ncbi:hypothetical protein HY621_04290 [Candidatus Uhrbacteria bacterium]|nr:hypothetical protein [Candidatus Uhrbacteria bacterium]
MLRNALRTPKRDDGIDAKSLKIKKGGSEVRDIVSDVKQQKKVAEFAKEVGGLDNLKDIISKLEKDNQKKSPDRDHKRSTQTEQEKAAKEAKEIAEKKFWEKRKGELMRQGLLNESILTRAQALLNLPEDWMVLREKLKEDEYIPKTLEIAQIRREKAHTALSAREGQNDSSQILDHAILDILLDQDTAEYLAGTDHILNTEPAKQNSEITRLNTMRGYLKEETKYSKGLEYDDAGRYGEYNVLLQGITNKGAAFNKEDKVGFRPDMGNTDIGRLSIILTHFRRDFLTILRVLAEHKSELGFASDDIPDDPLAVDRMAAHLYKYSKDRELEHHKKYQGWQATETQNSGFNIMDGGYYLGPDTSEQYQRVGQLVRTQTEEAIRNAVREMKTQENKNIIELAKKKNELLRELFRLEASIVKPGKKPAEKKSWLPWGKKENTAVSDESADSEAQNKLIIRREEVIELLQSDIFKPARSEPKNIVPSEAELVRMAIELSAGK